MKFETIARLVIVGTIIVFLSVLNACNDSPNPEYTREQYIEYLMDVEIPAKIRQRIWQEQVKDYPYADPNASR